MYGFMCKNKGAISVFLVIVLVPMLVVSSIFVDMSRVELAGSVAESSGVITMNTALTNYDAVLKDMYGLFATSQNTDEMFENLEDYYRKCIESAGVAEPDAENYVDQIMQLVKSETGSDDILNMDLTSFEITKPTGGDLANPAILKQQIVEFMKYRGPISLGSGIFEALGTIKNMKKQSELVEKKNTFYEKRTDMMTKLENVWTALEDYQYRDASSLYGGVSCAFPTGNYLSSAFGDVGSCASILKGCMESLVKYLYFADEYYNVEKSGIAGYAVTKKEGTESDSYAEKWTVNRSSKNEYTAGSKQTAYKDNDKDKKRAVTEMQNCLNEVYAAVNALEKLTETESYARITKGNANMSVADKIRAVSAFNSLQEYHEDINTLVSCLVKLWNLRDKWNVDDSPLSLADYNAKLDSSTKIFTVSKKGDDEESGNLSNVIEGQLSAHLTLEDGGYLSVYNNNITRVQGYWNETHETVKNAMDIVNSALGAASATASSLDSFLTEKIGKLDTAIGLLNEVKAELTNSESSYNKALSAWSSSANNLKGEKIGENDLSEINNLKDVLTEANVNSLIARLNGARETLNKLKTQLASYAVLGTPWAQLSDNYALLIDKLSDSQKASLEAGNYDTVINELKASVTGSHDLGDAQAGDTKSPDLTKQQSALYTWLYSNFYNESDAAARYGSRDLKSYTVPAQSNAGGKLNDNKEETKDQQKQYEEKAKYYNEKEIGGDSEEQKPKREYDTSYLPSGEWQETLKNIESSAQVSNESSAMLSSANATLSLFDDLIKSIGSMATALRDDMYISSYIMNMFSYSTYEQEIKAKVDGSVNITDGLKSWYKYENGKYTYSDYLNSENSKKELLDKAKTLTRVPIQPNTNYLYGKEVEYIIFGGDNPLAASYGTIYAIRFALNTAYAFTDSEINALTQSAAMALFGVPPLTPLVPVAKVAMIIGLALAESAYDLYQLKCGYEVPLVKDTQTWKMKPANIAGAVFGEITSAVADAALSNAYTALNDALEKTDEELEAMIRDGDEYLRNLSTAAVDGAVEELKSYGDLALNELLNICNNITAEFQSQADAITAPAEEIMNAKIAAAEAKLKNWLETQKQSDSDIIYSVKEAAVEVLIDSENGFIRQIFQRTADAPQEAINKVGEGAKDAIIIYADKYYKMLGEIQKAINTKVDTVIGAGTAAMNQLRQEAMNKLKTAAKDGVESLRKELKDTIAQKFGSTGGSSSVSADSSSQSVVASLLSWQYSDYLQLFLLAGLLRSQESVLLRTADVIQLNMQLINGDAPFIEETENVEVSRLFGLIKYTEERTTHKDNQDAFKLKNSYTYLNIKATVQVKPLMLTLPLIAPSVSNSLSGTKWYEVTYEGTMGY